MILALKDKIVNITTDIVNKITQILLFHRVIGWSVVLLNLFIILYMCYHMFFGYGQKVMQAKNVNESIINRNKYEILFGDRGFFFIFAIIFNVFMIKLTVRYVYRVIYQNFGSKTRDAVFIRQLLNQYGIMKY